jgi:hypothetical protein
MLDRQAVLEYLKQHPSHTAWQIRLHFLQASRQVAGGNPLSEHSYSSVSIGSIANQLNYILRDLEATGKIPPHTKSATRQNSYYSEYQTIRHSQVSTQDLVRIDERA